MPSQENVQKWRLEKRGWGGEDKINLQINRHIREEDLPDSSEMRLFYDAKGSITSGP